MPVTFYGFTSGKEAELFKCLFQQTAFNRQNLCRRMKKMSFLTQIVSVDSNKISYIIVKQLIMYLKTEMLKSIIPLQFQDAGMVRI